MQREQIELAGMYADEIKFFFQRDTWNKHEASFILVGILPVEYRPFGYPKLNGGIIKENERDELIGRGTMYLSLWESNPTNPDVASPETFVKWALSKKIEIPWLSFAIRNGLLPASVAEDRLKQNYDKSALEHYLMYDFWNVKNALSVLCGLDYTFYSGTPNPEMLEHHLNIEPDKEVIRTLCSKEYRLKDLWEATKKGLDYSDTPTYFIEWALSKRFRPDWLDWAIERGLYTSEPAEKNNQTEFDAEFDEIFGKASEGRNNQDDLVELDILHYLIAKELWSGASEEQARLALESLKDEILLSALDGKREMSLVEMATCIAAIENEKNINALVDAGAIRLFSPVTVRPTHNRNGAFVYKSEVVEKLASGEHLQYTKAQDKQETESTATPNSVGNSGRREQQHEIILAVIAALEFDAQQIPFGGKSKIKSACLTRPRLFTPDSFDHAWKVGLSAGLFKLANHEKYSPNK